MAYACRVSGKNQPRFSWLSAAPGGKRQNIGRELTGALVVLSTVYGLAVDLGLLDGIIVKGGVGLAVCLALRLLSAQFIRRVRKG